MELQTEIHDSPILSSSVHRESSDYAENLRHHEDLVAELRGHLDRLRQGGPEKAVALHRKRGKLTVRERIEKLVDPDTDFFELSPMAAFGMSLWSPGMVLGIAIFSIGYCLKYFGGATMG